MANSDSDCPWSSAHQSQKPKHCRKKRKAKLITVMDDNIDLKPKHGKKTAAAAEDPESGGASKISRPCSECGKKFWSWKALFGHMRCHPEREWRGINPPPNFRRQNDNKRSVWTTTEEDHEVAQSLLLLANGSCTHDHQVSETCVPLEAPNSPAGPSGCSRVFVPGQALGGHRASHKIDDGGGGDGDGSGEGGDGDQESKMEMVLLGGHKCSICQKVFSSGQALGGHKRCHWEKGDNSAAIVSSSDPSSSSITITTQPKQACGCGVGVDLNLPPPLPPLQHHSPLTLDLRLGL